MLDNIYFLWQKIPVPNMIDMPLPRLWALMDCMGKELKEKEKHVRRMKRRKK
jgi:hypothetical protein